jgi:hypothetical protein
MSAFVRAAEVLMENLFIPGASIEEAERQADADLYGLFGDSTLCARFCQRTRSRTAAGMNG